MAGEGRLPALRRFDRAAAAERVAAIWGINLTRSEGSRPARQSIAIISSRCLGQSPATDVAPGRWDFQEIAGIRDGFAGKSEGTTLRGQAQLPDLPKNAPKVRVGCETHGSIRAQEGEPIINKLGHFAPTDVCSAFRKSGMPSTRYPVAPCPVTTSKAKRGREPYRPTEFVPRATIVGCILRVIPFAPCLAQGRREVRR